MLNLLNKSIKELFIIVITINKFLKIKKVNLAKKINKAD